MKIFIERKNVSISNVKCCKNQHRLKLIGLICKVKLQIVKRSLRNKQNWFLMRINVP
jgi:hypothetical protein